MRILQGGLWALSCLAADVQLRTMGYIVSDIFLAAVSIAAALGFLLYGGRLFLMLQVGPQQVLWVSS